MATEMTPDVFSGARVMFDEYKPFVGAIDPPNRFWPVGEPAIAAAEHRLGFSLPSELPSFFLEVGHGFYALGKDGSRPTRVNRILSPKTIADIVTDLRNVQRPPEGLPDEAMPFFDLGEYTYLLLQPLSESPGQVYGPDGSKLITAGISEFFGRLYRNAGFYREALS